MKAAVIGAGIGGLAVSIRLAAMGYRVTVFEKNPVPGGKMGEIRKNGFRFDTGPSLFTLPETVGELFSLCGERMEDHLPCRRLRSGCRYYFPDGRRFDFYDDPEELRREILAQTEEDPEAVFRRLENSREVYRMSAPVFLFSSFRRMRDFQKPEYRNMALRLHKLDFFRTMHRANRRDFTDPAMVQMFDRYATYNGSDPYRAPATLNMIAHLENNLGAFFPDRGMRSIADSLYGMALRQGVEFRLGSPAEEVLLQKGRAVGVRAEGSDHPFDLVVCGTDVREAAEKLIPRHPLRKRLRRAEPSSSALIFYWGVRGEHPELDLHNIFFSEDYRAEFRAIRDRTLTDDPTVYVFISSKAVTEDAPAGCENWFVMINVPAARELDWDRLARKARRSVIEKLGRMLGKEIEPDILMEEVATPADIARKTGGPDGALYGTASNSPWSAFLRHPNFLRSVENLWFVGGSVHPGGGIPLCLASAKIVENEIRRTHGK